MDKYLIKSTLELLDDEPEVAPSNEFTLGILGSSDASYWNANTMAETINAILEETEKLPTTINLPAKGITSLLIQAWGEKQNIVCKPVDSDWIRLGKKARALQDSRIIKDSSHLLFFVGSRSDYYEKIAIREAKRKVVYTIDAKTKEIVKPLFNSIPIRITNGFLQCDFAESAPRNSIAFATCLIAELLNKLQT
jgi:hypothetical protein